MPLMACVLTFAYLIMARYPLLGHDYEGFFRELMAGRWHFAQYGLAPLRYAVQLCGGLPLYGHPNDISYSLTQVLALFLDPLTASLFSLSALLCAGYAGWFLLGRDVFRLLPAWAHVLALVVTAHGFHFTHALIGHENFFTAPLLGWMLWLLLSKDSKRCTPLVRTASFALLSAAILHAAGYFTLLFFAVFAAIVLPCVLLCRKDLHIPSTPDVLRRCGLLAIAALLLSSSKLVAIWSLMQTFPRTAGMSVFAPGTSPLKVVLGSLWLPPTVPGLFKGVLWGPHENSQFLSPVVAVGAVVGVILLVRALRKHRNRRTIVLAAYAVLLIVACLQMVEGRGFLPRFLHSVPPLSSMRVMMRLLYPFSLVLCIGSVVALQRMFHKRTNVLAPLAMLVTVVALPLAYGTSLASFDLRMQPSVVLRQFEKAESAGFERLPVTRVIAADTDFLGDTGLSCSGDALFLSAGKQRVPGLVAGSVSAVRDGAFNLVNPSCYAYPKENGCKPGDRIKASDAAALKAFTYGGPLPWKVSVAQTAADALSVLMLAACMLALVWPALPALRRVLSE